MCSSGNRRTFIIFGRSRSHRWTDEKVTIFTSGLFLDLFQVFLTLFDVFRPNNFGNQETLEFLVDYEGIVKIVLVTVWENRHFSFFFIRIVSRPLPSVFNTLWCVQVEIEELLLFLADPDRIRERMRKSPFLLLDYF